MIETTIYVSEFNNLVSPQEQYIRPHRIIFISKLKLRVKQFIKCRRLGRFWCILRDNFKRKLP